MLSLVKLMRRLVIRKSSVKEKRRFLLHSSVCFDFLSFFFILSLCDHLHVSNPVEEDKRLYRLRLMKKKRGTALVKQEETDWLPHTHLQFRINDMFKKFVV